MASATGLAANSVIVIDSEHIGVASVAGNVLTVQRGFNGTTAASHSSGADVRELRFRTLNLLAKAMSVQEMKEIVKLMTQGNINAAIAAQQAEVDASVQ